MNALLSLSGSILLMLLQGLAESLLFSKLVRLQYGSHRQGWEQDGKPAGPLLSARGEDVRRADRKVI